MWVDPAYKKRLAIILCATYMVLIASCAAQMRAFSTRTHCLIPPSQSVAPAILTADSGPKRSGAGNNWSQWYRLGAGKAPSGYTLQNVEFWLTGERECGAGAECRELAKNDGQVLWEFRLRGGGGTGRAAQGASVAHIRVFYRPQQ
jgi:hypothetical protein